MLFYSAEKAVNERLAHTPELYLLALAQFAIYADTDVVSIFKVYRSQLTIVSDEILFTGSPSPLALSTSPDNATSVALASHTTSHALRPAVIADPYNPRAPSSALALA